jgi:hypothetical protein
MPYNRIKLHVGITFLPSSITVADALHRLLLLVRKDS